MSLCDQFRQRLQTLDLIGRRVLVAVSGGADSVALLRLCQELHRLGDLECVAAHFDHATRPVSADDARWVAELCAALGIECLVGRRNTDGEPASEERLRAARYDFLTRSARACDAVAILTGHTRDDQAETILHHLLRGTGVAGLTGIPAQRELEAGLRLVRPLLAFSRDSLRDELAEWQQDCREDPSNESALYTRNRIRHELMPLLKEFGFTSAPLQLEKLATQAEQIQQALDWQVERILADPESGFSIGRSGDEVRIRSAALANLPRHLAREVCVQIWKRMNWPRQKVGFDDWDRLVSAVQSGKSVHLPGGIEAVPRGETVRLRKLETP